MPEVARNTTGTFGAMRRRLTVGALASLAAVVLTAASATTDETPIADAMMRGDSAEVRTLLKQGLDVNAAQADGMTALHWAASRGDAATTRMLLFAGARPSAVTRNGNYTPLHMAARKGRGTAVKALLEGGADPRATTSSGGATALHFAAGEGDSLSIAALLAADLEVDAREGAWEQTPLMWAAAYNRVPAIRLLVARGADVEAVSKVENMAEIEKAERAELTARSRRVAALKAAERGPLTPAQVDSIKADSVKLETARLAAMTDDERKAEEKKIAEAKKKAEEKKKADAKKGDSGKDDAAPPATAPGQRGGRGGGLSYGDLVGNKGGLTPLLFAVRDGNNGAVDALLAAGAKVNHVAAGDKTSPLLMATINGRFDMAKMLLEKGADPKLASDAGATPLYSTINVQWAAKSLYPQPTAQQQQQTTHVELMEALIKAGADVNARLSKHLWYMSYNFDLLGVNTVGATAFWRAAYGLDVPAMKMLVANGADITLPTTKPAGRSFNADDSPDSGEPTVDPSGLPAVETGGPAVFPIHAASGVGYGEGFAANSHQHAPDAWLPSITYLVEVLGVDVNQRDHNGYNALHHAAARGDTVLGQYLIDKGADITALSRKGQTVADMANGPVQRVPPFVEAVDFFVRKGSKNNNKCLSC